MIKDDHACQSLTVIHTENMKVPIQGIPDEGKVNDQYFIFSFLEN